MTYKGHVENGTIVLDDPVELPEGAVVKIEVANREQPDDADTPEPSFAERYRPFIGALDGMPEDWSQNHDHYLREEHRA
jgi:hypothetical protein